MGLVTRVRDKLDERQVRVRVTPSGQTLRAAACDIPAQIRDASGERDELRRLRQGIEAVRDRLERVAASRPSPVAARRPRRPPAAS